MTLEDRAAEVIIVGGGIAGLTAAWELARAGVAVTLFEAAEHLGGRVRAGRLGVDRGAESFALRTDAVTSLIRDAALALDIVDPEPDGARLIVADAAADDGVRRIAIPRRAVLGIPADPAADDVRSVIGDAAVERALAERSLPWFTGEEPSLADLVTARCGSAVADLLVEPVCRGVHSRSAHEVRLSEVHPTLWAALREHGSLLTATAAIADGTRAGSAVAGIAGGMWRLADALADAARHAGAVLVTGAAVRTIASSAGGRVTVAVDGSVHSAHRVVLATGAGAAATLLGVAGDAGDDRVRLVTALLDAPALAVRPLGTGAIVSADVDSRAKAITHVTAKWAWARAVADGREIVRVSARDAASAELADPGVLAAEITALTGVPLDASDIHAIEETVWHDALTPDAARRRTLTDASPHGVVVTGATVAGTGLASVIPHARDIARALVASLTTAERTPA